jgi:signal peptidase
MTPRLPSVGPVISRWAPRGRKAIRILSLALLLILVGAFLIYAFPALVGSEGSYVVLSGSMEPSISAGDVVFVYATDPSTIDVGDIVTFSHDNARIPVTHRVTEVIETNDFPSGVLLRTVGDANEDPDPAAVAGGSVHGVVPSVTLPVVGTVLFVFPYMGHVIQFANTSPGFLLLVGLPLAAFILNEIWTVARGRSRTEPATPSSADPAHDSPPKRAQMPSSDHDVDQDLIATESDARPSTAMGVDQVDIKATIAVLGIASVYAVWVAYSVRTPWSISAVVAAAGSFLYFGALRYRFLSDAESSAGSDANRPGPSIPDGGDETPAAGPFGAADLIEVDSLEALRSKLESPPGDAHDRQSASHSSRTLYVEEDGVAYNYSTRSTGESAHERSPKSAVAEARSHEE